MKVRVYILLLFCYLMLIIPYVAQGYLYSFNVIIYTICGILVAEVIYTFFTLKYEREMKSLVRKYQNHCREYRMMKDFQNRMEESRKDLMKKTNKKSKKRN